MLYEVILAHYRRGARRPMRQCTMRLNFHAKLLPPGTRQGIRNGMDLSDTTHIIFSDIKLPCQTMAKCRNVVKITELVRMLCAALWEWVCPPEFFSQMKLQEASALLQTCIALLLFLFYIKHQFIARYYLQVSFQYGEVKRRFIQPSII